MPAAEAKVGRPKNKLPDTILGEVGELIRHYRIESGLTVDEIAEMAGVDRSTWYRIEGGTVDSTLSRIEEVAAALGVPVDYLLDV